MLEVKLISFSEALNTILSQLPTANKIENVSITQAFERILAEDIISPINVPAFNNSAMDGFAIRFEDLTQFSSFKIVGKSLAGQPFTGNIYNGGAIKIMTGALLPKEVDTVIMQEYALEHANDEVSFKLLPQKIGENVRYLGEEIKQGEVVLSRGAKLNALALPLLASLGLAEVKVFSKIKVGLFSTGSELVNVGEPLQAGQIYDLNRFSLGLMLKQLGCEVLDLGILSDDPLLFAQQFTEAEKQADLIITSGGVSIGEADFIKQVLGELGEIKFWKIAMKPGKPFAFGKLGKAWFCGLPGNPVSALVTFYQLVQPAINKLNGYSQWRMPALLSAKAQHNFKKKSGRQDFQRGKFSQNSEGQLVVETVGFQGSHLFSNLVHSNCFIVLEEERGDVEAGEMVSIQPFNWILE